MMPIHPFNPPNYRGKNKKSTNEQRPSIFPKIVILQFDISLMHLEYLKKTHIYQEGSTLEALTT